MQIIFKKNVNIFIFTLFYKFVLVISFVVLLLFLCCFFVVFLLCFSF